MMEIASNADAFQPIDGAGRACRGTNETDTQPAYYVSYNPSEVATLAACKAMCVGTPECQGIQFSIYGCQVWTRPEGIENTAISPALTCLRYSPFRLIDGFEDRSCKRPKFRGHQFEFLVLSGFFGTGMSTELFADPRVHRH